MARSISVVVLAALLGGAALDVRAQAPKQRTARKWDECQRCLYAYQRALEHTLRRLAFEESDDDECQDPDEVETSDSFPASFPAKMVMGWLLLADERQPEQLAAVLEEARNWKKDLGENELHNHRWNWYPALAGTLLAEHLKHNPDRQTYDALKEIVAHFVKWQEPTTGGWFKSYEGAVKRSYPVKTLGFLDSMIYGFLRTVQAQGIEVPPGCLRRAEQCLNGILTGGGVSYGTGQRGGDKTGARGAFSLKALDYANDRKHRLPKIYASLLPRQIPNMNKGHHIGAFHCLGVALGCHTLGKSAYKKLADHWVDKLIDKQKADGGIYVGDDEADGGEVGLIGADDGSTAAAALLIALQDPTRLNPDKRTDINWLGVLVLPKSRRLQAIARYAAAGKLSKALPGAEKAAARRGAADDEVAEAKALTQAITDHLDGLMGLAKASVIAGDVVRAEEILEAIARELRRHNRGKAAKAELDRMKKDAAVQAEKKAAEALDKAWKAVFAGGQAQAKPLFEKVVADYPKTVAAKNAREMLAED